MSARAASWLLTSVGLLTLSGLVQAATHRCDDQGRITYTDLPCPSGRQSAIDARAAAPSADDRAAADMRQRADEARLASFDAARERERRQDARAAALAARRDAGRGKEAAACTKLALRAKRAHEDDRTTASRDLATQRRRVQRAEDDYAALCRNRS